MASTTRSAVRSARSPSRPDIVGVLAGAHRRDELLELGEQGIPAVEGELLRLELRRLRVPRRQPPEAHRRVREEVDREVAVALEEADLAHGRRRDATRRQVRDAARGKLDARVGDVDLVGDHRNADRLDALGLLAEQLLQDVEVVDHEVAHHVHVGAALRERAHAVGLDEARRDDPLRASRATRG